ncbi:MAG TPA: hypothetical protein PLU88_10805, partial [Armatimonadota bacterium]|nr:hypothetical protein [Armatimonadota bacterium]
GEGEKTVIYRSPFFVVSSQDGKKLYASDKTADCIVVIDASAGKKLTEWPVVKEPTGLALSADGKPSMPHPLPLELCLPSIQPLARC